MPDDLGIGTRIVTVGFEKQGVRLRVSQIIPTKRFPKSIAESRKFRQILSTIKEVGILEPPMVARNKAKHGTYLLLDGHLCIMALKTLRIASVDCLVSTDDEAFTYNRHINHLAKHQARKMIVEAVKAGVPEDRLARVLNLRPKSLRRRVELFEGICDQAIKVLNECYCPIQTFAVLKRMTPLRQMEAVEFMVAAGNFKASYAQAILAGSRQDQTATQAGDKTIVLSSRKAGRVQRELTTLRGSIKELRQTYATDMLNLAVVKGYVARLLANELVARFLTKYYDQFVPELQAIAGTTLQERVARTWMEKG